MSANRSDRSPLTIFLGGIEIELAARRSFIRKRPRHDRDGSAARECRRAPHLVRPDEMSEPCPFTPSQLTRSSGSGTRSGWRVPMRRCTRSRLPRRARAQQETASSAVALGSSGSGAARASRRRHGRALEPVERGRERDVPPSSPDAIGCARRRGLRNRACRDRSASPRMRGMRPLCRCRQRAQALPSRRLT